MNDEGHNYFFGSQPEMPWKRKENKMEMEWKLQPIVVGKYSEQVLVRDNKNNYPLALTHIDTFWEGRDKENKLYNLLYDGNQLIVKVTFDIV